MIITLLTAADVQENIDRYHTIWLVCLIAAICFLLVAIVLFVVLKIPKVFLMITGISRKKAINEITESAEYTSQLANLKPGKPIPQPKNRKKQEMYSASGKLNIHSGSVPITQIDPKADYADPRSETTLLSNSPEESLGTTVLSYQGAEMETSVLSGGRSEIKLDRKSFGFRITREILLVHTNEEI